MESGKVIILMSFKIQPITADASFRNFYRLLLNKKTRIIIITKKEKYKNLVAYCAVNNYLRKNKILSPKLFNHNLKYGTIVIEDFGKLSFYEILLNKKNKIKIYKKIVDLLIKIQKVKPRTKIKSIINKPHIIKNYSNKYLHRESDLFFDWYLPLFYKKKKIKKIKKNVKKNLIKLYNKLINSNKCFVHRDFHVQNLMKVGNKIGLIDTQDALIGSPAYDLASLIDDVRIKTTSKLKNQIYNYYIKKNPNIDKDNFLLNFNILSVQRSLKIIGIFSRLYMRDKKDKYLKLIPYAWKLLESRMDMEVFSELKQNLDKNISKAVRKKIINK